MPSTIAVINAYPRFDAVFDPVALEMRMAVRKYQGIGPMADDLNAKTLPAEDLALIIVTGTSEKNDAAQYRKNMSLLAQMAKHSKLKAVPVLFLGYKGDTNLSEACEGCGAVYLALPVRKSELLARIRGMCGKPGSEPDDSPITKAPEVTPLPTSPPRGGRSGSSESERRLATVMFADISGFTAMSERMDPEEVTRVMNGCFKMMEDVIHERGGTIDKFIGDCVMVLFGVPRALENAPLMALNTAIEMRNGLYRFNLEKKLSLPLDIHIGINTGTVLAGQVGGDRKKEFTVMGDAVNLASRIEGVSEHGQILVGPDTWRATKNDFDYRTLAPVTLKGKAEPVPVYEVISVKEAKARRRKPSERIKTGPERMIYSEMVGRDDELNELRHALTGLLKGKGGIVNVIGEAGIGKSRLMAELKSDPAMKQVALLEGQAISMGRNLPFYPIIDLLKNWAGIREDDVEAESLGKLDKAIRAVHPSEADEIIPFVATMMGMKLTGKFAERVKGIEGEALEKLIFKNVRELLIKGAELRPMIIRVEDLHWADTSSIEMLTSLFRLAEKYRIIFLSFFRPNYPETGDRVVKECREEYGEHGDTNPPSAFGHLPLSKGEAGRGIYTEIHINPLDEGQSSTLISNLLNIKGLPQSLRDQITERAGGNPFFIEEVVRSLIDEGAVVKKGDSFTVTDRIHEVKVPLTINEVLMSRIDRLDDETRNLIRTASVIGRYFFYKIIAQVAQNISDINSRLAHLEDIQLIRERKRLDELEYLFKHALAQEAAYESILIQKRKELHLHVAQAIESVFGERLHEFYGMLAWHYSMGDNLDKTEEYMLKAGEEAMKASASSEALEYFIKTMELYKSKYGDRADPAKIYELEKNIALSYYNHGDFVEAIDYFTRVLEYNGEKIPENRTLKYLKFIWGFINILVAIYFPVLKWRKPLNDKVIGSINLFRKKLIALVHPDPQRFFIEFNCSINLILNYNILNDQYLLRMLPSFSSLFSWPSLSCNISKAILNFSGERLKEANEIGFAILNQCTATHEFMVGLWKINFFDEATVKCLVDNGDIFLADSYIIYIGFWSLETGNILSALLMVEKMSEIGETYDHLQTKGLKSILELRILMKSRRLRETLDEFDKSIAFFDRIGERILHFEAHTFKARALLLDGDIVGTGECLDYLNGLTKRMGLIPFYMSDYIIARFMYDTHQLEDAISSGDNARFREYHKKAKQSRLMALKISRKFKRDRTEALKLAGTRRWLLGEAAAEGLLPLGKFLTGLRALRHYRAAVRWWKKSIDMGMRLGAKLELSRTYAEIGKRLGGRFLHLEADPNGGTPRHHARLPRELVRAHVYAEKLLGLSPEECLEKAEAMFREMGLEWDLAELEKVRDSMVKNN